ncbi:MAG: DNA polymerase IV, partial [Negativicutes bacterium]
EAKEALLKLAGEVGWRLRRAGKRAHTIQLKLRLGDFSTFTRQRTFPAPLSYDEDIYAAACTLLDTMALPPRGIRLLGISGSGFDGAGELSLFDDSQKKERLYTAIDGLRRRFGESAVTRAPLLKKPPAAKMLSDDDEA